MKPGYIRIAVHSTPIGIERYSYTWEGGDIVRISRPLLQDADPGVFRPRDPQPGQVFWTGPFKLRCLKIDFLANELLACREGRIAGRLHYALYRGTRVFDGFYRRSLLTLAIWGFASHHSDRIPTWRTIYALAPLVRWEDRRRARKHQATVARINERLKREG